MERVLYILHLKIVGVREKDEVINSTINIYCHTNAISYCGAKPIFIDVD